ncbi:MAG: hypothetical protein ACXW2X_01065 [Thermoanaerobaculia bacterium]
MVEGRSNDFAYFQGLTFSICAVEASPLLFLRLRAWGQRDQFDADAHEHVRTANINYILQSGIHSVEANVVYAVAGKT